MCSFLRKHVKVFLPLAEDPVESKLAVRQRALARNNNVRYRDTKRAPEPLRPSYRPSSRRWSATLAFLSSASSRGRGKQEMAASRPTFRTRTAVSASFDDKVTLQTPNQAQSAGRPSSHDGAQPFPRSNSPESLRSVIIRCLLASVAAGRASWHVDLQPHVSSGHNAAQQGHPPAEAA